MVSVDTHKAVCKLMLENVKNQDKYNSLKTNNNNNHKSSFFGIKMQKKTIWMDIPHPFMLLHFHVPIYVLKKMPVESFFM